MEPSERRALGQEIKALRQGLKPRVSQEEAARRSGLTLAWSQKMEQGVFPCTLDALSAYIRGLFDEETQLCLLRRHSPELLPNNTYALPNDIGQQLREKAIGLGVTPQSLLEKYISEGLANTKT